MTDQPRGKLPEVKRYRPQVVKDGNCRHGFGVRMVTSEKASDSDWRGEDSRQWVEYSDYAALATRLAAAEARVEALQQALDEYREAADADAAEEAERGDE